MEYKFTKSSDKEHKITIDSCLIYAAWKTGVAPGGGEAQFEVRTSFVGQGAQIEIVGKGEDYGKFKKKVTDKIINNHYVGNMPVPDDIKIGDTVWFEVKLSKQGIKGRSNNIVALPIPVIKKMQWDKKEARRGDIVRLQAELDRVEDEIEVVVIIYEYDLDGNHDKVVSIPTTMKKKKLDLQWEYEYHEDVDEIPTEDELQQFGKKYSHPEYFFVIEIGGVELGKKQESGLLKFKDWVRIELRDQDGKPVPNEKYNLILADGTQKDGKLNGDGFAKIEDVPPGEYYVIFPDVV